MPPQTDFVFLNGRIIQAARATVSAFDRGLLYGDGLFETIRAYRGMPFALSEHLDRLQRSAVTLGFHVPEFDWAHVIGRLLARNQLASCDAALRLTVTRGPAEPNLLPPASPRPTSILTARPIDAAVARKQRRGVSVTVLPFTRGGFFAEHKLVDYVPAILGKTFASQRGCDDGIYAAADGSLREATTASLFIVRRQSLATTPVQGILPGVTRKLVLDLARKAGIHTAETSLTRIDLVRAEEAFLTASVAEIVPVVRVDDRPIGNGRPGTLTRRMQRLYRGKISFYHNGLRPVRRV